MLRIRLLGGLEVEADGRAIEPPPGKPARGLLAWLALNPGTHARSRVAAALWRDVLDQSARLSLRTALSALRDALGEEATAVVATREQIGLAPDVWVDIHSFDRLVVAGRLEEAVELHRGDLLPELDQDWVLDARDGRRALLGEVVGRLGEAEEERGDFEAAVRRSRELVAIEPLSEEAHRALMRRLAARGDRAAALAAFERFRERLRAELGMAPAPETRELAERLRRGEAKRPKASADQPRLPSAMARRHRSAFVGRGGELALVRQQWQLAKGGERQLVVVLGEPGVGKSRLAAELARAVHAEGAAVLLGRCTEEPLLPYQPFAEALRLYLSPPAEPAGELARLIPGLADQAGAGLAATEPEGARFRLFEAVGALLATLSEERPLLLVLEDLHWADMPTLLLLSHLVRAPEPSRLLVLGTYRDTELGWGDPLAGALAELRRERTGTRLRLQGLDEAEITALVSAWVGTEAPAGLAAEVHRRTEGNPFFVEEVLSHLTESGAELAEVGVPEGVKEVVGQRLGRLSEETRRTLVAASVLGRRFDLHVLAAVLEELSADQLADALDETASAGLVREEAERAGRFAFSHALVRETLYGQLTGARRAALHGRAAAALERLYGEGPERVGEIAHHLFEAAAPPFAERGIDYAVRAADLAVAQLANEDAALQLKRALRALELLERPDEARRCKLLLSLGDARLRAGERADGRAAFAGAARAARALGRADLLARAALGFGGLGVTILEVDEATVALLEEALAALGDEEAPLRTRVLARLAVELYYGRSRERSEALGAEAVELARRSGDQQDLTYALNARHVSLWRPDRLDERLAIAREMVALAERTGDREGELQGRNWFVPDLFEAGEMEELDGAIDAYEALAGQLQLPAYEWYVPLWRGALAALRGELADAEPRLREAVRIGTLGGDRNVELADQVRLGIHCMRGDFAAMHQSFVPMAEPKIGSSPASLSFRCGMAFLAAGLGREAEAREHLEHIAAHGLDRMPFDVNWLETIGALGEACAMLGDADRAAQLYGLLLPYEGRIEAVAGRALASWGAVDRHLGVMAAAMSRWEDAERHFEAALRENERLGFRPWLAWTRCQYAQMLGARDAPGDRERVGGLLTGATDLASELGLEGLQRRIAGVSESIPNSAAR